MDIEDEEEERRPLPHPLWVMLALWGTGGRTGVWVFFWLSVLAAIGCVAYGFVDWRFFIGGGMAFAALWYYLAIRWVDQHGTWE
jgi:hypothetical protein